MTQEYMTYKEVAEWLRCEVVTIHRWLRTTDFPKPIKFSRRHVVFEKEKLKAWLDEKNRE